MSSSTNWNWIDGMAGLFVISFVLAVPLAVPLLFLLRARVRRFMRERTRATIIAATAASTPRSGAPPLHLVSAAAPREPRSGEGRALFARMRRARRTAALLYAIAGIAAACVPALVSGTAVPFHFLWPVLLIVGSVAVPSFRARMIGLLVVYLALFGYLANVGSDSFGTYTLAPTLLLMLAANRWLKTISLVLALVAFSAFGAMGGAMVVVDRYGEMGWLAAFVALFALDLYLVYLVVRGYERKFFSDASYQFAIVWLMFVPWWAMLDRSWWRPLAPLALYTVLTRLTLPLLRRRHGPVSLLVLRVFGAAGRSQRLFDELGTRWRYVGPIHLIAGADSATVNLDLSEALRYLTFRFRSLYVSDERDLERRLAALDCAPDPDGRYRVNDFFCFNDTWQHTFTELLRRSDAVLVDLSGYGPQNAGVAFELGQLLAERPLDSFVLVTDDTTNGDHLGATLQRLWRTLDPSAPNARVAHPVLHVLHEPKPRRLVAALCDAVLHPPRSAL